MYCLRLTSLLIRLPLLAAIAPLTGLHAQSNYATPYAFTTFAAIFGREAVAVDGAGNVYVAGTADFTILKITSAGVVTTLAGASLSIGSADGTGFAARFNSPTGVAVDGAGNVYVADQGNDTIRKITSAGVVTTLAGMAGAGFQGSADGTGSAARFFFPYGVAVDAAGNVYVTDRLNNTIRKITAAGVVTTLAGTAGLPGSTDGTGSAARFNDPRGVAVDGAGNVYVADQGNYTIRKITSAGVVTTLAGTAGLFGSTDGTGSGARFFAPAGVAVDAAGNIYVTDRNDHTIRKITAAGVVTTLAGTAGLPGSTNGTGSAAQFRYPVGVAVDRAGNLYVADEGNSRIRKGVPQVLGDFNGDGKSDLIWTNTTTGDRYVWLMNGTVMDSSVYLGNIGTSWQIEGSGDFNADGKSDLVWTNTANGDRYVWLMNGTIMSSSVYLGNIGTVWQIDGIGDFDGDGKSDLVWTNTANGDRYVWLMNGTVMSSSVYLGNIGTVWQINATGDFNGDGKSDLVWTNTANGDRYVWLMNGAVLGSSVYLGNIGTIWQIDGTGDFNGDSQSDLVWTNSANGDRYVWLMNGAVMSSSVYVGNIGTSWDIRN